MDELENDSLSLLLMFDDNLFPQFLEWAQSNGWADLVLFMMEVDSLRFRSSDSLILPKDKTSLMQSFHLIWKNSGGCFNKVITKDKLESLKRLTESLIPFNAVFSYISELVWVEVLQRCRSISTCSSWPSIRKSIIASLPPEEVPTLTGVLDDGNSRKFFERFLNSNAADLCCLHCWLSVKRILLNVETSLRPAPVTSTPAEEAAAQKKSGGFMGRWRGGGSASAMKSANKTLQGGSGSMSHHSGGAAGSGSDKMGLQSREYNDPFEAFKVLLEGTRALQKQFFPGSGSAGTTSSGANYVNVLSLGGLSGGGGGGGGGGGAAAAAGGPKEANALDKQLGNFLYGGAFARSIDQNDLPPPKMNSIFSKHSAAPAQPTHISCGGLSESLRMEISATLSLNSAVRTRDIETVDEAFAFACANMLEKLLHNLEKETYTHIQKAFKDFEASTDYVTMLAHQRAGGLPAVAEYSAKSEFINDRVRHLKRIPWNDHQSRGKLYLFYEEALPSAASQDEDEAGPNVLSEDSLDYLDSMGNTSMSDLLAMKTSALNMINSFHVGHAKIGERGGSLHDLRKDSGLNQSSSGWTFSKTNSRTNSMAAVMNEHAEKQQKRIAGKDDALFNPDIVGIGLEFFVPEDEAVSADNIQSVTSHLQVWVGGETKAQAQAQQKSLPGPPTAGTRLPATRPSPPPLPVQGTPNTRAARRVEVDAEYQYSDSDSSSDSEGEEEDVEVLVTNQEGGEIDYDKLISTSSRPPRPGSASPSTVPPAAAATGLRQSQKTALDFTPLDLPSLDAQFNAGIAKSVTESRLSLKQLISSLVLSLVASMDDLSAEQRFSYESEASFSFITDSRGLQNLNELIYCHQVHRQGVSEFVDSFAKCHQTFLLRAYGPATVSPFFNVNVCIKSSPVAKEDQAGIAELLASSSAEDAEVTRVTSLGSYAELHSRASRTRARTGRFRSKVNVGLAYSLISPKHCMVSLLRNISLQVYYQSLHGKKAAATAAQTDHQQPEVITSGPAPRRGGKARGAGISSADLVSLNSNHDMRRILSTDSYSVQNGDVNNNHRALRLLGQLDKRVALCFGVETLYDIYLGAKYLNTLPSTLNLSEQQSTQAAGLLEYEYSFPIMKHLGLCDFAMCATLGSLSSRLLVQILMLLLTDKSVLLLSTNLTTLTKLQYAIPRLIWPFRIDNSHSVVQILTSSAFTDFVYRDDPFATPPPTSSGAPVLFELPQAVPIRAPTPPPPVQAAPVQESSLNRMFSKINNSMKPSSFYDSPHRDSPSALPSDQSPPPVVASVQQPPLQRPSVTSPSKRKTVDPSKSLLVCCNSKVYINASAEERARLLGSTVKGSSFTVFDLDSCTVVKIPSPSDASPGSAESTVPTLGNDALFKCINADVMRELFAGVAEAVDDYNNAIYAQNLAGGDAHAFAKVTSDSNAQLERTFYLFWTELVLRALPRNINYFHSSKVLSCDIKCMVSELMANFKSGTGSAEEEFLNKGTLYEGMDMELVHFLTVEEFIVYYNSQLDAAANNLLHVFYKELLLDHSPVFTDLLKRHCKILEYWSF